MSALTAPGPGHRSCKVLIWLNAMNPMMRPIWWLRKCSPLARGLRHVKCRDWSVMNTQSRRNFLITTCTVAAAGAVAKDARMSAAFAQTGSATGAMQMAKISEFGRYEGYSEALFDRTRRTSDYLTLSNGTRLAYDLILPTKNGVACDRPLPVLFKYTPYLRTFTIFDENGKDIISPLYQMPWVQRAYLRLRYWLSPGGRLIDPVFRDPWLGRMLRHGYAVVVVERPGTGASFGRLYPSFEAGARESDEIMNWIAAQAWSNGNIGMFGDSWQGQIHSRQLVPVIRISKRFSQCPPGSTSTMRSSIRAVCTPKRLVSSSPGRWFSLFKNRDPGRHRPRWYPPRKSAPGAKRRGGGQVGRADHRG